MLNCPDRYLAHIDWAKTPDIEPTLPALLRDRAARFGPRNLLVVDDARLTYSEADTRSAALAGHFLAAGVGKDSRVGLLLPNGPELVVTWLALGRIGAVAVPVSTLSSGPELARIFQSGGFALLVATDRHLRHDYLARIESALNITSGDTQLASPVCPHLRNVWLWRGEASWAQPVPTGPAPEPWDRLAASAEALVKPADPLTIIFTSGSTAAPKGVIHSHGNFLRSSRRWAASMPYQDGDRLFGSGPMFWVGGLVTSLLTMMQVGGALINSSRNDASVIDLVERERCTTLQVWPHLARELADEPSLPTRDWSAMRAGSVLAMIPPERRNARAAAFGFAMGMTETAGPHSCAMAEIDDDHIGAMGLLAPGMEHRIVDPETREDLREGQPGEMLVRGNTLMLGYVGRERHEVFDADGWFATGDICSVRDGHLFFHGRRDAMIKTAGANVAPAEVEAALLAIDGVAEAHVVGLPDETRGQIVGAIVIPAAGRVLNEADVAQQARALLSSYKVPRRLIVAADIPRTGTNKLDRREAMRMLSEAG